MSKKEVKKDYEIISKIEDPKINILVTGCSGCGKSTLINAVLNDEQAETGIGYAITKDIQVYENAQLPFRMIDTIGFEYNVLRQMKIKHDLEKWGKKAIKEKKKENIIHAIWFCVDGTIKRIPKESLDYLHSISVTWKNAPILVVFTKSYSKQEIEENKTMFVDTLSQYKKNKNLNIKEIIAVVAKPYPIDPEHVVSSFGLDELILATNKIIPEAKQIALSSIKNIDLQLKKNMAYGYLSVATVSASVVGAIPIPVPDATILLPLQMRMLKSIAKSFNISDKSMENQIIDSVLKAGTTTIVARSLLNTLKANPALNIAADVLNAAVAGLITFVTGEIEIITFENVYKGTWDLEKIDINDKVLQMFKDKLPDAIKVLETALSKQDEKMTVEKLGKILMDLFKKK